MDSMFPKDGPDDAAVPAAREYVVIARRYRPQAFDELIGQQHVSNGLAAAIATSRVGHAYLFTGARGTGKTSTARILAKALNCEKGPTPTPCNQCDACRSITAGEDMDVLEIDGASNRQIDDIRQLRQNVNVRPSRSRFKIYIIDEVHMLTKEAFNALLKTLEEPPEHVKFIFCTTDPEKVPITILSRCQRFDFAGVQTGQIIERLRHIATAEGVEAEPEALEILARRAAGSMRDSQSLLEQLLAFGSRKITVAEVHSLLGTAGAEQITRLVQHLIDRNPAAALAELDQSITKGVDVGQLLDQLLGYFRDIMAVAVGCPAEALLSVSSADRPTVQAAAKQLGLETILAILQILDQTLSRLKSLTYPRTVAELALVRICKLEDLDSLPQLISQLREGGLQSGGSAVPSLAAASKKKYDEPAVMAAPPSSATPSSVPITPPMPISLPVSVNGNGHADQVVSQADASGVEERRQVIGLDLNHVPPSVAEAPIAAAISSETALALWHQAAEQLGGSAAEMSRQAVGAAISGPNKLVITFQKRYNFCKQFCERPDTASQLKQIIAQLAARPLELAFELKEEEPGPAQESAPPLTQRQKMNMACQRPFARKAIELFDANPVRLESAS